MSALANFALSAPILLVTLYQGWRETRLRKIRRELEKMAYSFYWDAFLRSVPSEDDQESVTCPKCRRTSYHPKDVEFGWCGACCGYTSPPKPQA